MFPIILSQVCFYSHVWFVMQMSVIRLIANMGFGGDSKEVHIIIILFLWYMSLFSVESIPLDLESGAWPKYRTKLNFDPFSGEN